MPRRFTVPTAENIAHYLSNLVFAGLIRGSLLLPYKTRVRFMGRVVDRIVAPLAGSHKRIRNNLKFIWPDMPDTRVSEISHGVADTVGRMVIELYSGQEFYDRMAKADVSGPGLEPLLAAHRDGKRIILVGGHFANYVAIGPALTNLGLQPGVLYRPMHNPYFNAHYVDAMKLFSKPIFEQSKQGIVQMIRHMRSGGVMGILTDVDVPDGEPIDFMGKPARTSTVVAELALKNDALLVPTYAVRQPNGVDFKIQIHAPIAHTDPITMTQDISDGLTKLVKQHPEQWFWVHKRWKI